MNILDLVYYSGLNKFLYTNDNLVSFNKQIKNSYIIQLNLNIKEVSYIKNNFDKFKDILENLLYTFNQYSDVYYKNITYNTIVIGDNILNNCIFLYSSKNKEPGFIKTNSFIEFKSKYYSILKLIKNKDLSVRNLINLGVSDNKARELYEFLKNKGVFEISKHNHTNKIYSIENYINIGEKSINEIIFRGV